MHRDRTVRLLSCWVFVAALLLKSAVPMLASAAAGLQGKAVAEICDVYGVDMTTSGWRSAAATGTAPGHGLHHVGLHEPGRHHDGSHEGRHDDPHARHDDANARHGDGHGSASIASAVPAEGPGDGGEAPLSHRTARIGHGGDHCVLSALALAPANDVAPLTPARHATASVSSRRADIGVAIDPVARWAAQLRHGPPASS